MQESNKSRATKEEIENHRFGDLAQVWRQGVSFGKGDNLNRLTFVCSLDAGHLAGAHVSSDVNSSTITQCDDTSDSQAVNQLVEWQPTNNDCSHDDDDAALSARRIPGDREKGEEDEEEEEKTAPSGPSASIVCATHCRAGSPLQLYDLLMSDTRRQRKP